MLLLLVLVVALAVVSVTTVAKLSSVNSRNIAMMQEQCRDAVALSTTLSRTASSSSAATVGTSRSFGGIVRTIKRERHCTRGSAFLQRKILKIPEKKREMRRLIE